MAQTLYAKIRPKNFLGRWGMKFLESMDLSENLLRIFGAVNTTPDGILSLLMFPLSFFLTVGFASLAFVFDIESSWAALDPLRELTQSVLIGLAVGSFVAWLVQIIPFTFTVLPTVAELLGSRFAQFSIASVQVVVWFFIGFDLLTDIPRVNEFLSQFRGNFYNTELVWWQFITAPMQLAGWVAYGIVFVLFLLSASYFFELLTILFAFATILYLWKSIGYWAISFMVSKQAAQEATEGPEMKDVGPQGSQGPKRGPGPQTGRGQTNPRYDVH